MPELDKSSLIICLQALEKAIKFNEFLSQSETVEEENFEEINYRYELTLNKLAKIYNEERKKDSSLWPLDELVSYKFRE